MIEKDKNIYRVFIKEKSKSFYSTYKTIGGFVGTIFDQSKDYLYLRCFTSDIAGNIHYGSINRIVKDDIDRFEKIELFGIYFKSTNTKNGFLDFDEWLVEHKENLFGINDKDDLRELYLRDKNEYYLNKELMEENNG